MCKQVMWGIKNQLAARKLTLISGLSFKAKMDEHATICDFTKKPNLCSKEFHAVTLHLSDPNFLKHKKSFNINLTIYNEL